jgi:anti-sigma B factor antagonist
MELARRTEGSVVVAKARDTRVDARLAAEFKQSLLALTSGEHPRIALDLSDVEFLDSSGLGAIVAARKELGGRGDLVIVGAKPAVANLFRLTRMDKVFRMFPAAAEAVAALTH